METWRLTECRERGHRETSSRPRAVLRACSGYPQASRRNLEAERLTPRPLPKGTCALPFRPLFPSWAVPGSRLGGGGGGGLRPSARPSRKASPPGVTYHLFCSKSEIRSVAGGPGGLRAGNPALRCCPRAAVARSARTPSRGRAPRPAFRSLGDLSARLLPPSLAPACRFSLRFSFGSLSWQAETPLSRTCRQNAAPVAGYHCPPRRGAGAAVRLHHSQREWPVGGKAPGGGDSSCAPLVRDHVLICRHDVSDVPRAFCRFWQTAPFQLFRKVRAISGIGSNRWTRLAAQASI